jgi:putative transposase
MTSALYRRHRFPPEIIQHAIWLYLRLTPIYRIVEELLADRGLDISWETVRRWVLKCATAAPASAERSLALDEMVVRIAGEGACRRSRGRGPRHAGPAPTRHPGGAAADAQALKKQGLAPKLRVTDRRSSIHRRQRP